MFIKLLKVLCCMFAITFMLNCVGINAARYKVYNNIPVAGNNVGYTDWADKKETSLQYVKNITSTGQKNYKARVTGKDLFGYNCTSAYRELSYGTFVTLGNQDAAGCGITPVNGKAIINITASKIQSGTTRFWGTWITDQTIYDTYQEI